MIKTKFELKQISDTHLLDIYEEGIEYKDRFEEHYKTELTFDDIIIELKKRGFSPHWIKENEEALEI